VQLASLLLPVYSVVSVNYVNIWKIKLSHMNFFCDHTILIPQLPGLFNMANGISSMVVLVNSETSYSVSSFNLSM
jgi:hypothetical protein